MSLANTVISLAEHAPATLCSAPSSMHGAPTIFHEDWWLEAAAGPDLQQIRVEWGGKEVARLNFVMERKFGFRNISMPAFTRVQGPLLSLPEVPATRRVPQFHQVTKDLVARLPEHDSFWQIFDPACGTPFAFSLFGFKVEASYTFRIPRGTDPQGLWKNLESRRRKAITDSGKVLAVEAHGDLDRFERMSRREYSASINTYDYAALRRIFGAAHARDRAVILAAVNEQGQDAVNAIIIWDSEMAYFWLATRDHARAGRGAKSLVAWHAVQLALQKGLAFDFDSFSSPSGARFVSSFGVPPVIRPVVMNRTALFGLASACSTLLNRKPGAWWGAGRGGITGRRRDDPAAHPVPAVGGSAGGRRLLGLGQPWLPLRQRAHQPGRAVAGNGRPTP